MGSNYVVSPRSTALDRAYVAPAPANRLVSLEEATSNLQEQDWFLPESAGTFKTTVLTGASATVLPAPPSGFVYVLSTTWICNDSASATITCRLKKGLVNVTGVNALAASGISGIAGMVVDDALTFEVSGSGVSASVMGTYRLMPADLFKVWTLVVTDTFQAIDVLPPAGKVAMVIAIPSSSGGSPTPPNWTLNLEASAATTIIWRFTRGSTVFTATGSALSAASIRGVFTFPFPGLLSTDLVEVRASAAPTAGTVTCGGFVYIPPQML